jgi:hypothetical protein
VCSNLDVYWHNEIVAADKAGLQLQAVSAAAGNLRTLFQDRDGRRFDGQPSLSVSLSTS